MEKVQRHVITVVQGQAEERLDWLAQEWPLIVIVNGRRYITLLATPANLDELAVGFALGDGLLNSHRDILALKLSPDQGQVELELAGNVDLAARMAATRVLTTGCGKGSGFYRAVDSLKQKAVLAPVKMAPAEIVHLMQEFSQRSQLFSDTGAVHAAALADGEIQVFREDVARHNAIDKLVGNAILGDRDVSAMCLLTSGRISSELVLKAARLGLGLLLSRSAPTALAVELAQELGITIVGFIRGQRCNIYCNPWRII